MTHPNPKESRSAGRGGGADPVLTEMQVAFLDGLLEAWDDLPDGAWQCACEGSIASCPEFKGMDPYEVWLAWCMTKAES